MKTLFELLQGSVTGKVLFIGALILVLLIPLGMIEQLMLERSHRYDAARAEIARSWGGAQTVGGPILVVPFEYTHMSYAQPTRVTDELYVLPQDLDIAGDVHVQQLRRGIYEIPTYTARLAVSGRFAVPVIDGEYDDLEILWSQAQIALPLGDPRAVKEPVVLRSGAASAQFDPANPYVTGFGPQLTARYTDLGLGPLTEPRAFSFDLVLGGTGTLHFLPLGNVTRVRLAADWPSPSFGGEYLPDDRNVTDDGFTASWRVLDLGRGYAARWRRSAPPASVTEPSFGVSLIAPVGVHEASLRAAKYGVLIIGLTFVAYFLFELFAAARLHALQYLLIGAANSVFYLLLLALAEHIGFALAYAASAAASIALIVTYSAAVLGKLRRAAPIGALLAALYAFLYVTLRAEDYALLFGALALFVVLAAFMYLTRHVDWFEARFNRTQAATTKVQLHA